MPENEVVPNTVADEITFGVEIECNVPRDIMEQYDISVGGYRRGHRLMHSELRPFNSWTASNDQSVRSPDGYRSVEFVSPVLKGKEGIDNLHAFVSLLNEWGVTANTSCGVHVHVGLESIIGRDKSSGEIATYLNKLLKLVSKHEHGIYALINSTFRLGYTRGHTNYCRSIKTREAEFAKTTGREELSFTELRSLSERYRSVNLQRIFVNSGSSRTIEFRIFGPTVHPDKVVGYALVAMGFAQKASERLRNAEYVDTLQVSDEGYVTALNWMHSLLQWAYRYVTNGASNAHYRGMPTGVWEEYGAAVLSNQRWNARRFEERGQRSIAR